MVKDASITRLLALLPMRENSWVAVDHWDADLCAIGIAPSGDPRRLVYVCTFDRRPDRYYYECEIPIEDTDYVPGDSGDDVSLDDLVRAMTRHFADGAGRRPHGA